ncbi:hypothetical protein BDZ90DRAFT_31942 [Jaminaea rosea]|uniref:Uncharacterized protein n=1 Tax=Jaminaea rosea TaxID=1569628 RepID=A0A316V212_9BASI|nr:hypothetical protein BDZ90DRAFT_31942 [Jaminaea rosea]PWN31038.1 hypothetical protein BDZ90DRAFT_31942 [Jaminaea rosea]
MFDVPPELQEDIAGKMEQILRPAISHPEDPVDYQVLDVWGPLRAQTHGVEPLSQLVAVIRLKRSGHDVERRAKRWAGFAFSRATGRKHSLYFPGRFDYCEHPDCQVVNAEESRQDRAKCPHTCLAYPKCLQEHTGASCPVWQNMVRIDPKNAHARLLERHCKEAADDMMRARQLWEERKWEEPMPWACWGEGWLMEDK